MTAWGIAPENQLLLWDWVGGRYSLWSCIGLPIALSIGVDGFKQLLAGAYAVDQHFQYKPLEQNIPVLMGLLGAWNTNFLDIQTHAILPYDGRLKYFASYLQQLEMESNGKSIQRNGEKVQLDTCPIIWGEVGPNAQHAFTSYYTKALKRSAVILLLLLNVITVNNIPMSIMLML